MFIITDDKTLLNTDHLIVITIEPTNPLYELVGYDTLNDRNVIGRYKDRDTAERVQGRIYEKLSKR